MKIAIIGSGAVGKSIHESLKDDHECYVYNTKNIHDVYNESFDLLLYAGVPGVKWKAIEDPDTDMWHIMTAYHQFQDIKADQKVLISTIDAGNPQSMNYGANRRLLEKWVVKDGHQAVRLPALVGKHVVKNQWYDSMHSLPQSMNIEMTKKVNSISKQYGSEIPLVIRDDNDHVYYTPSKDYWEKHHLGIHLAHHPQSNLVWLDIDNLGQDIIDLMKQKNNEDVIYTMSSSYNGYINHTIKEMYKLTTGHDFPIVDDYSTIPIIDHLDTDNDFIPVNTISFSKERK